MSALHDVMVFVRWRLIALRYAGKLRRLFDLNMLSRMPPRTEAVERIRRNGHDAGPSISPRQLQQITAIYCPRTPGIVEREKGHPFVNLLRADDIVAENPVLQLAFSPAILDLADDYFAGDVVLDSVQVLYSWPTEGAPQASQLWHKDYGDSKSFHWIAYLNDVMGPDDGPFAFIDKEDTKRISRSAFIRRIEDETFSRELGNGRIQQFLGRAGESMFVDPAACYHSGSRCRNARLAIFVTFNSGTPYVAPVPLVVENRERLARVAREVRPDLSHPYLRRLLQLR